MEGVQYQLADFIRGEQNPLADSVQSTACLGNEGKRSDRSGFLMYCLRGY